MEQSVGKKRLIILAAGGLLAAVLVAAHYRSPLAARLAAGRDVELVLLNGAGPILFVYHPFSRTVNAIQLPDRTFAGAKGGVSAYQRACEASRLISRSAGAPEGPFYIESAAPDLAAFETLLNGWRSRPARLFGLLRRLWALKRDEGTNLSRYELILAALELVRLNSSNFIKEDLDRVSRAARAGDEEPAAEPGPEPAPAIVRLEVLNASGKKDLAGRVTKFLRKEGFDVISFGTYGSVEARTKIVNCSDNIEAARKTREVLGLGGREIYSKFNKLGAADARIVLGEDFDEDVLKRGMR